MPEKKRERVELGKRIGAVGNQAIARVEIKGRGFFDAGVISGGIVLLTRKWKLLLHTFFWRGPPA